MMPLADGDGSPKSRPATTEGFDLIFHRPAVEQVLVYPNPTRDLLTIQATFDDAQYSIVDMTGTYVLKGSIRAQRTQVDVSDLAAGSYSVTITYANGTVSRRFNKVD